VEKSFSDKDPFSALFLRALSEISVRYASGALRHGERKFPRATIEIKKIEEMLNTMWRSGDEEALKEFRDALKRWYHLNLMVIENYRSGRR
jgi:hypothetical protein